MGKLPEFKDWQAPWEKSGEDFDAEKARKFIYDLHKDVETKADELKEQRTKTREAETARDEAQTQLQAKVDGTDGEAERLSRELATANKKLQDREDAERTRKELALDVALDIEGITAKQAKALAPMLAGSTKEELADSAESIIEALGVQIGEAKPEGREDDDEDEDKDGEGDLIRLRPGRAGVRTGGDPDPKGERPRRSGKTVLDEVNELFPT